MYQVNFINTIHNVEPDDWNALCSADYPFIHHEFFSCLEDSGATSAQTGWQPHHLIIRLGSNNTIVAIVPLFIKSHSYGEYIFDWAWADAYHRHKLNYYPKLLNAIPFTPATGQRWLIREGIKDEKLLNTISDHIITESKKINASSCHCLFTEENFSSDLHQNLWQKRISYQYHWFNRGYTSFESFLKTMSSRKRKNIIKERLKITDQNIEITIKEGHELTDTDWRIFYQFYSDTYLKRSGHTGYLSIEFFLLLGKKMPDSLVMIQANSPLPEDTSPVAAALFFKDDQALYGRYWGCHQHFDSLHFELCYYQGIEYAIKHELKRFDAGAQGEHKIQRGFEPIKTYSNHWIHHKDFNDAITEFITIEAKEVLVHIDRAKSLLPFKK